MKLFLVGLAFLASAYAGGLSVDYLPPGESGASHIVETNLLESEPAHILADDGYRYKTVKRFRLRHRRDVNELSSEYLPPQAGSSPSVSYAAAPAVSYEAAPAVSYASAPAVESFEVSHSEPEPAHTLSVDGYRYKTVKRYRVRRRRRDVNELVSEYLPPQAASAPAAVYSAPSVSFAPAEEALSVAEPVLSYASAPAASSISFAPAEPSYEISAAEPAPAHTLSNDGYRYKTVKRFRYRHRH